METQADVSLTITSLTLRRVRDVRDADPLPAVDCWPSLMAPGEAGVLQSGTITADGRRGTVLSGPTLRLPPAIYTASMRLRRTALGDHDEVRLQASDDGEILAKRDFAFYGDTADIALTFDVPPGRERTPSAGNEVRVELVNMAGARFVVDALTIAPVWFKTSASRRSGDVIGGSKQRNVLATASLLRVLRTSLVPPADRPNLPLAPAATDPRHAPAVYEKLPDGKAETLNGLFLALETPDPAASWSIGHLVVDFTDGSTVAVDFQSPDQTGQVSFFNCALAQRGGVVLLDGRGAVHVACNPSAAVRAVALSVLKDAPAEVVQLSVSTNTGFVGRGVAVADRATIRPGSDRPSSGLDCEYYFPVVLVPFAPEVMPPLGDRLRSGASQPTLALIIHAFYPEYITELLPYLANIDVPFCVFVSTTDEHKHALIQEALRASPALYSEVRIVPNRGRDIAPKLIAFRDVHDRFAYVVHLHSKRSSHSPTLHAWRVHILECLFGSVAIFRSNVAMFERDGTLGLLAPKSLGQSHRFMDWGLNRPLAESLAKRMGFVLPEGGSFDFPAGSMFMARSKALGPLLNLDLQPAEFGDETGAVDGTMAHAIERLYCFCCEAAGYRFVHVAVRAEPDTREQYVSFGGAAQLTAFLARGTRRLTASPSVEVPPEALLVRFSFPDKGDDVIDEVVPAFAFRSIRLVDDSGAVLYRAVFNGREDVSCVYVQGLGASDGDTRSNTARIVSILLLPLAAPPLAAKTIVLEGRPNRGGKVEAMIATRGMIPTSASLQSGITRVPLRMCLQ